MSDCFSYRISFYAVLLFLLTFCFFNSLSNDFVYDDSAYVKKNPYIRDLTNIPSYFFNTSMYQDAGVEGEFKVYRPLVTASFALDYFVWKLNPFGFHLTNTVLHFIAGVLVFVFFMQLGSNRYLSSMASLVFLIHPVQVEAVTWISGRGNMLYSIFALFSMICFLKFIEQKYTKYYLLSLVSLVISLFSKEMGVNVIPLLFLILFYKRKPLRDYLYLVLPVVLCIGYLFIRQTILGVFAQTFYIDDSVAVTFYTMTKTVLLYFFYLFFPIKLDVLPQVDTIKTFFNTEFLFSFSLFILVFWFISKKKSKHPVCFGLWWIFLGLLPVLNIVPLKAVFAERFLYLSVAGFGFGLGGILENRRYRLIFSIIILSIFLSRSIMRNKDWSDSHALWSSSLRNNPYSSKAHNGLGVYYLEKGDINPALTEFSTAVKIDPKNMYAVNNLANVYKITNNKVKQREMLEQALKYSGKKSIVYHNLGLYYLEQGEYVSALSNLSESVRLNKNYANAFNSLGICYSHLNREDEAVESWYKAIKIKSGWKEPYYNMITHFMRKQDRVKAQKYLKEAMDIYPADPVLEKFREDIVGD